MINERFDDSEERPLTEGEIAEWEAVEPEPGAPRSAVLTVRFSPHELRMLRDAAKASGTSMADVIRSAVADHLRTQSTVLTMGWGWSTGIGEAYVLAKSGLVTRGQGLQEEVRPSPA